LRDKIQDCIIENAGNLKVQEAVDLIQFVAPYADAETIEILDKIIGGNVHDIPVY
jgi:hypothetical protein